MDEVLSSTLNEILKYNKYTFNGVPIARKDVTNFFVHHIPKYKASDEYSFKRFNTYLLSKVSSHAKPLVWAKTKLAAFKKQWYSIFVVTARPDAVQASSWKWVQKHFPWIFDGIVCANQLTNKAVTKSSLCKKLWIQVMIEDNLEFSIDLAKSGIKVFLIDNPWNQNHDPKIHKNIIKVKKRKDIVL